jgi:ribonuclease P protein component
VRSSNRAQRQQTAVRSSDRAQRHQTAVRSSKRVLRSSEFRKIYQTGVRVTSRYFAAFCLREADTGPPRCGFTVPKALGKAVTRNRLKRRMREAVRSQLRLLPANWAIVFNPRRSVLDAPFEELCREVGRVFARCSGS